ncbi:MAG: glycosyltransferase [Actinobacteria bacterium]|nr:glycosyltransferase [Actinomycetota bacterium]
MSRWFVGPENDYRGVRDSAPDPLPTVSVIIPVYNRPDLLERTLAGLRAQSYPQELLSVVVADDGSDVPIKPVVDAAGDRVSYVSQSRRGYGAGRARNLGARSASGDVLIFVDADCVPHPDLVARHAEWHRYAPNLVVIGNRRHADTTGIPADAFASGEADWPTLLASATSAETSATRDWRTLFYRRTSNLRAGDEVFRSLVSSNFSVRAPLFASVGGFDESFDRWGGEDTELGWRFFNHAAVFVPDNDAVVVHQVQQDEGEGDWRDADRHLNDAIIRRKIPHPFYRKPAPGVIFDVPRVSWIIVDPIDKRIDDLLVQLRRQVADDAEFIIVGDTPKIQSLGELTAGDPRVLTVTPADGGVVGAIHRSRGAQVAFLNGWASLDHRLIGRSLRRLDGRPRAGIVRSAYQIPTPGTVTVFATPDDIASIDAGWGPFPVYALVRRRELMKALHSGVAAEALWGWVSDRVETEVLRDPLVGVPQVSRDLEMPGTYPPITGERTRLLDDLSRGGGGAAARTALRYAKHKAQRRPYVSIGASPATPVVANRLETGERRRIFYVGWLGRNNLGDEAMFSAIQRVMPEADIGPEVERPHTLMLGGGTLINRHTYLAWLRRQDSPRVDRVVFGTGIASPEYWGDTESIDGWKDFLSSCSYVGLRGPQSMATLRSWGFEGEAEILGDSALALERPPGIAVEQGSVLISPAWTKDELWGGSDAAVLEVLEQLVVALRKSGRTVTLFACNPEDDRLILEIMRASGDLDIGYVPGYLDQEAALAALAAAEVVVAERLHGAVLAAAVDTPFVALEYRPKVRDFAASVTSDHLTIRTDELDPDRLLELVDSAHSAGHREALRTRVVGFRDKLIQNGHSLQS